MLASRGALLQLTKSGVWRPDPASRNPEMEQRGAWNNSEGMNRQDAKDAKAEEES